MKKIIYIFTLFFCWNVLCAQDTFSIVAVDPETGEVGSAGATCLDTQQEGVSAIIISGLMPGKGAMNSQAYACIPNVNLNNGTNQMGNGLSPEEVIDWLIENDQCFAANFNPQFRQYGIADFDDNGDPRAAGFTGSSADDYKDHIVGPNYSIQGNILIGEEVLTGMENGFLNTEGSLAKKLMAAMQGANIPGADARCLAEGVSSRSAFLRVARPDDTAENYYLELHVPATPFGKEPIDSLQTLYNEFFGTNSTDNLEVSELKIFPNPTDTDFQFQWDVSNSKGTINLYNTQGQLIHTQIVNNNNFTINKSSLNGNHLVFYQLKSVDGQVKHLGKLMSLD